VKNLLSVRLSTNSIYAHSIIVFKAISQEEFSVEFSSGKILSVLLGRVEETFRIFSVKNGDQHVIEIEILNWINEKVVNRNKPAGKSNPENRYGMRYYPFVSSMIEGGFKVNGGNLIAIILDIPDKFRIIWYGAEIKDPNGVRSEIDHSYGKDISTYIFQWNGDTIGKGYFEIKLPVRIGASSILNLVNFPLFYLILALIGVSLASLADKPSYLVAAIATSWVFMLRRWRSSNLPQRNTILTHGYIIAGTIVLLWGIAWKWLQLHALFFTVPIIVLFFLLQKALRKYGLEGELPDYIASYWSNKIKIADKKQREAVRKL
jgi:hypothetical protein